MSDDELDEDELLDLDDDELCLEDELSFLDEDGEPAGELGLAGEEGGGCGMLGDDGCVGGVAQPASASAATAIRVRRILVFMGSFLECPGSL